MTAPVTTPGGMPKVHFRALDGYRFLAAALIVVAHTWIGLGYVEDQPFLDANRIPFVAVAMFFMLSGFLLYRPFAKAHLRGRPMQRPGVFLRRRLVRIYPLYWVVLTAYLLILDTPGIGSFINHVKMYLLLQVYDRSLYAKGIAAAWTLCVELTFYLVLPLLAIAARRLAQRMGGGPDAAFRAEALVILGFFVVGPVWRMAWLVGEPTSLVDIWLPAQADLFATGMALALLHAAHTELGRPVPAVIRGLSRMPWVGVLLSIELLWLVNQIGISVAPTVLDAGEQMSRYAIYLAVCALLIAPMVFGDGSSRQARFLGSAPMARLSILSYGLYLWHMIVLLRVSDWFGGPDEATFLQVFPVGLTIALLLAFCTYHLVEVPALRLRDGVPWHRAKSPDGAQERTPVDAGR